MERGWWNDYDFNTLEEYRFYEAQEQETLERMQYDQQMEEYYNMVNVISLGMRIGFPEANNNHGCTDYAIGVIWAIDRASRHVMVEVVEANSCFSCWQVGHTDEHVFADIGDVWRVPFDELFLSDEDGSDFANVEFEHIGGGFNYQVQLNRFRYDDLPPIPAR